MSVNKQEKSKDFSGTARLVALGMMPLGPISAFVVGGPLLTVVAAALISAGLALIAPKLDD